MSAPARVPVAGMSWQLSAGFVSDRGRVRERNEDAYTAFLPYAGETTYRPVDALFAVADGMGGHAAGEVASNLAIQAVEQLLTTAGTDVAEGGRTAGRAASSGPADGPEPDLIRSLEALFRQVNRDLCDRGTQAGKATMGCTLTVVAVVAGRVLLAHVGDSRCYRLRRAELTQLTPDHSWVGEQRRAGLLSADEEARHPKRNLLTQCLGITRDLDVFVATEPLEDGSRYLLCSDGLHGLVPDSVLARVLKEEADPQVAATRLAALANEAGGDDNVTALVLDARLAAAPRHTLPERRSLASASWLAAARSGRPWLAAARSGRPPLEWAALVGGTLLVLGGAAFGGWLILSPDPGVENPPMVEPAVSEEGDADPRPDIPSTADPSPGFDAAGEPPQQE